MRSSDPGSLLLPGCSLAPWLLKFPSTCEGLCLYMPAYLWVLNTMSLTIYAYGVFVCVCVWGEYTQVNVCTCVCLHVSICGHFREVEVSCVLP